VVLAELAEIAVVALRSDPELIGYLGGRIEPEIGKGAAALAGVHGQPIVVVGVYESLRDEAMNLEGTVKEFEFLGVKVD
jgi:hypothetical protein